MNTYDFDPEGEYIAVYGRNDTRTQHYNEHMQYIINAT